MPVQTPYKLCSYFNTSLKHPTIRVCRDCFGVHWSYRLVMVGTCVICQSVNLDKPDFSEKGNGILSVVEKVIASRELHSLWEMNYYERMMCQWLLLPS